MKSLILIISLFIAIANLNAQSSSYFKIYGTNSRDEGYFLKRTCDSGFILAGVTCSIDAYNDAYITKLDSSGNKLWNWNIGFGGAYDGPFSVMETPDSNIIVFISSDAANVQFRMAVFDYGGNLIFEKHDYYLSGGFPEFSLFGGAELLPDGRIVTPVVVNDSILKAYWWDQSGDTLSSVILDTCKQYAFSYFNEILHAELFLQNDTIVFSFNNNVSSIADGVTIIKTDFDGLPYYSKTHSNFNFDIPKVTMIYDNKFLCSRNGMTSSIYSYLYDYKSDSVYREIYYSEPNVDIQNLNECMSKDSLLLFCGGVFYNLDSTRAFLMKLDTSGNKIWLQKYHPYGYNRSYLSSVKHFEDCIAAIGYAYNATASPVADSYDILFVKADLNGNATSITTFEKPDNTLTVFPNPASDLINVNLLPVGESLYTIVDAGGRELLKGKTQSNQISISSLPAGCYQLLWENDGKKYCAGFVKE